MDLETWFQRDVAAPLGWQSMGYKPLERGIDAATIAPTERDEVFRQRVVRGTVHDPGAAMQGGVGGHAGLFSNAYDLAELGELWLRGGTLRGVELVEKNVLTAMDGTRLPRVRQPPRHGLRQTCIGPRFRPDVRPGFLGKLWAHRIHGHAAVGDPVFDLVLCVLSNRTYPDASNASCSAWTRGRKFNGSSLNIWGR